MRTIKIFGRDVMNIFCDASIKKYDTVAYGCPGSLAVDYQGTDYQYSILPNSTNNESEIYAILLATQQYIKYKDRYRRINIFSDSRISVSGIRDWMIGWIDNQKNGILMSTSGPVANQQIFLHIINLIMNYLDDYHLYHIDGHINTSSYKEVYKVIADFKKFNDIDINTDEAIYLCTNNNTIDNTTRQQLELYGNALYSIPRLNPGFIYPIPMDIDKYKHILDN